VPTRPATESIILSAQSASPFSYSTSVPLSRCRACRSNEDRSALDCARCPQRCNSSHLGLANGGSPTLRNIRQARRSHKSKSRLWVPILAFTNSANRTVINSTVASTPQLSGGQLLPGRSLGTGLSHSCWGFCSLILADALARWPCFLKSPQQFDCCF